MARRVLVRQTDLLLANDGSEPLPCQIHGQIIRKPEACQPCYYPSWQCHTKARKQQRPKAFAVSQRLAEASAPTLFESHVIEKKVYVREVYSVSGYQPFYNYIHTREWISVDGAMIVDGELKEYDWRWTGQFNTYIGVHKSRIASRLAKRGKKYDQQKQQNSLPDSEACPF